jgi:hypothetical protein
VQSRAEGISKAKRLRYFLKISDSTTRVRVLTALWEYRCDQQRRKRLQEQIPDAKSEFDRLIARLGGSHSNNPSVSPTTKPAGLALDARVSTELKSRLIQITTMSPQPRGYEFERFLKTLFDTNDLGARASFRLTGEQIDGSFQLLGETYLLDAKMA